MYVTDDGDDEDEFDSVPIGRCSAIYHYAAQQDDELSIERGLLSS